jgi:hypothetical protein
VDGVAVAERESNAESTESDDTEEDDAEEEDESESEEDDEPFDEDSAIKKCTAPRYQADKVILGSGSTRPAPSFMSTLKAGDSVTARQPSIVRDLWAQVMYLKQISDVRLLILNPAG